MIFRFPAFAIATAFSLCAFQTNAQGFGVDMDSTEVEPNKITCVPARALGFNNIQSFQYSLTWDPQVLEFDHVQNLGITGWLTSDFNKIASNRLLLGWSDILGEPRTKPDGAILYEICFKAIALVGNSSEITPGTEGFPPASGGAEARNALGENVWNPNINTPGYVEIVTGGTLGASDLASSAEQSFQLAPNPTQSTSQVIFKAANSGAANLSVTDASGRTVLEQKITVRTGENRFEIPAKALTAKGMYQVSLKTDLGVSTQMLSVQ